MAAAAGEDVDGDAGDGGCADRSECFDGGWTGVDAAGGDGEDGRVGAAAAGIVAGRVDYSSRACCRAATA